MVARLFKPVDCTDCGDALPVISGSLLSAIGMVALLRLAFHRHVDADTACSRPAACLQHRLGGLACRRNLFQLGHALVKSCDRIYRPPPPRCPRALLTVALPLANPTPRPRVLRALNMGAFLYNLSAFFGHSAGSHALNPPEHIRHNEQTHVRPSNVDPVQMRDSPVALRNVDVFQLYVHVILGYTIH